jgi:hypothetical protein
VTTPLSQPSLRCLRSQAAPETKQSGLGRTFYGTDPLLNSRFLRTTCHKFMPECYGGFLPIFGIAGAYSLTL